MTIRKTSLIANTDLLTPREAEATRWLAEGNRSGEVAILMDISMKTVEIHTCNSMRKLRARNRAQLIRSAIREGIVPCPCWKCTENSPFISTLDESKSAVGDAGTIQGLQAELKNLQAQIASARGRAKILRDLIEALNHQSLPGTP